MFFKTYLLGAFLLFGVFGGSVFGQELSGRTTLDAICRVETVSGQGTGFTAAVGDYFRNNDEAEFRANGVYVFTAGHVVKKVGELVSCRFAVGTEFERLVVGEVVGRRYTRAEDWAVIWCEHGADRPVLALDDSRCGKPSAMAGYSPRHVFRRLRVVPAPRNPFDRVKYWIPKTDSGESGSPLYTADGVHSVAFGHSRLGVQKMMTYPISDWLAFFTD